MDHHHHHHGPDYGRAFAVGIALNAGFIAAEAYWGRRADSLALLADAGHNASDVMGLLMAWWALRLARKAPSPRFTYGLQSASIMAALANAVLLLAAVATIAYEAWLRLGVPVNANAPEVMAVAGIGVLINGLTAWFFRGDGHDVNIRAAYAHMAADAAISLGVVLSGACMLLTGRLWLDPVVSLAICAVIVLGSWRLLKDSLALSLHAVPAHIDAEAVRAQLAGMEGVAQVHDLHIWAMSTTGTALSAHLMMPGGHPGDAFIRSAAAMLEHRFHITHATIQIELGPRQECAHDACN